MKQTILILSCEHASSHIPPAYHTILPPDPKFLHSFAALDIYAKELTETIAKELKCDYILGQISRYLMDLNKHHQHEDCFSSWAKAHLNPSQKEDLLQNYYHPYQQQLIEKIQNYLAQNLQVIHLSIHTLNPKSNGREHNMAISILYDPNRHGEKEVARVWHELLIKRTPYRVRLNYPRTGRKDNLTSILRKQFEEKDYLGLELECNASLLEPENCFLAFSQELCHSIFSLIELL